MFIPLSDDNPLRHVETHYVTLALIAANVLIFVFFQSGFVFPLMEASAFGFGLIPQELFGLSPASGPLGFPETGTMFTYMFLHGGWMHLIGNMAFLWVFGDNVEDAMGHVRFFIFYLACGVLAGLAHAVFFAGSGDPLVGASGAVAGVIAAYLILHPRVKVWVLALGRIPLRLPAFVVLGLWVAIQIFNVVAPSDAPVAWWAHIGGLIAGAVLVVFMRRPGVLLFDRNLDRA
ncbi:MAG: rhomboid family intramembrane serine protease [Pseudomonadota bacterium]